MRVWLVAEGESANLGFVWAGCPYMEEEFFLGQELNGD